MVASGAIKSMFAPSLNATHADTNDALDNRVLCVLALANLQRAAPQKAVCSSKKAMHYSVNTVVNITRSLPRLVTGVR